MGFSASFELAGSAREGELILLSPIGTVVGQLQWSPGRALLIAGGEPRRADSVEALTESLTGTPLPVGALFDWLDGRATSVPGWDLDLSQRPVGRLSATRLQPAPRTELRVVLQR